MMSPDLRALIDKFCDELPSLSTHSNYCREYILRIACMMRRGSLCLSNDYVEVKLHLIFTLSTVYAGLSMQNEIVAFAERFVVKVQSTHQIFSDYLI